MERLHRRFGREETYRQLVSAAEAAQAKLESAYPQIFVSDEEIKTKKKAATDSAKNDPEYKAAKAERAAAYRALQDYLYSKDERLARVVALMDAAEGKP
jgi:hypothetical protein